MKARTRSVLIAAAFVGVVVLLGGAAVDYWLDWSPGVVALPAVAIAFAYLRMQERDHSSRNGR
jgi:4-hydroxybenzoate polyprenyltransferase